jgi:hypothetical protein
MEGELPLLFSSANFSLIKPNQVIGVLLILLYKRDI